MSVTDDPTAMTGWQCERWMGTPKAESSADAERLRADKKRSHETSCLMGDCSPRTRKVLCDQGHSSMDRAAHARSTANTALENRRLTWSVSREEILRVRAHSQDAQKSIQLGRRRVKTGSVPLGYVEDFDEPRTTLEGFFNIRLVLER